MAEEVVRATISVEARPSTEVVEWSVAEWQAMTPAERRDALDEAVATAVANAGGAGYWLEDPEREADLVDAPSPKPGATVADLAGPGAETAALVVVVGAAGSGKSTWVRRHFVDTQILSTDGFRGMVADNPNDQDATANAVMLLRTALRMRLARGLTTVIDSTAAEAEHRAWLVASAAEFGMPAVAVVFATPLEECRRRNDARTGPEPGQMYGRRVPDHVVRRQHEQITAASPHLTDEGFAAVHRIGGQSDPVGTVPTQNTHGR